MTTLHEAMNRSVIWKPKDGTFGIEIETETKTAEAYPKGFLLENGLCPRGLLVYKTPELKDWVANTDGSLRNFGIEYIFREPLSYEKTVEALWDFEQKTKGIEFLQDQPSTSVHVHVNFGNERLLTMANFMAIWTLFEIILLDFSGPTRRSNLFASGIKKTEGIRDNYVKLFAAIEAGVSQRMVFNEGHVKYAALNIATLARFGSLEVRCFRGTTKVPEIIEWVSILNKILEYSRQPGLTPKDFLSSYRDHAPELLSDVFGEFADRLKCDAWMTMMDEMMVHVWKIVSSVKNWETFGLGFPKPRGVRTKKLTDAELIEQYTQMAVVIDDFEPSESDSDGDF